jgi:predicted amidohydrolase YtcJ
MLTQLSKRPTFLLFGLALVIGCARTDNAQITMAVVNARIWTGDPEQPWAEAMAVSDAHISAIGSSAEIGAHLTERAHVIDAKGAMIVPGFIDAHVHFIDGGLALSSVSLRDARTREEFIQRIAAYAKTIPKGEWIRNGDWDHTNWGGDLPTHAWIDSVTPDNPVWINRLDGHMSLANAAAMAVAKVDRNTSNVVGGAIVRDAGGNPTGIFKDNAMVLIDSVQPPRSEREWDRALDTAMTYVAARGVTSVHHMGTIRDLTVFNRAHRNGTLRTRIMANVELPAWAELRDEVKLHGRGDDWLRIGGLKGFVDGSLGSHTAAMNAPFSDAPRDSGFFVTPPDSLYAWTKSADEAGLQVAVHAIGDRAIRTQLDIFERVAKENGTRDRRFRIEHAQHIAPEDIPRFGILGVIASMQPYHAVDDGRWAEGVIGPERAKGTYAFRSLLDAGATLAFGSDWFVAPPTPLEGIQAAVTRRTLDGKNPDGWVPEQKITVTEALTAYTRGSAYAAFQESKVGVLRAGMLADFVMLGSDLTTIAPETIGATPVLITVVGGKVVFTRQ